MGIVVFGLIRFFIFYLIIDKLAENEIADEYEKERNDKSYARDKKLEKILE